MPTGKDILKEAESRIGKQEYYLGADVPFEQGDDYRGETDCAEFVSEVHHEVTGTIIGALRPDSRNPDPWTGEFYRQMKAGELIEITVEEAVNIPGAMLLKKGHIAFSDGQGGTVEAMGRKWGVCRGKVGDRFSWGILAPGVNYAEG